MDNLLFIAAFIGGLIVFFIVASNVGRLLKYDDYWREHKGYFQKKSQ